MSFLPSRSSVTNLRRTDKEDRSDIPALRRTRLRRFVGQKVGGSATTELSVKSRCRSMDKLRRLDSARNSALLQYWRTSCIRRERFDNGDKSVTPGLNLSVNKFLACSRPRRSVTPSTVARFVILANPPTVISPSKRPAICSLSSSSGMLTGVSSVVSNDQVGRLTYTPFARSSKMRSTDAALNGLSARPPPR